MNPEPQEGAVHLISEPMRLTCFWSSWLCVCCSSRCTSPPRRANWWRAGMKVCTSSHENVDHSVTANLTLTYVERMLAQVQRNVQSLCVLVTGNCALSLCLGTHTCLTTLLILAAIRNVCLPDLRLGCYIPCFVYRLAESCLLRMSLCSQHHSSVLHAPYRTRCIRQNCS